MRRVSGRGWKQGGLVLLALGSVWMVMEPAVSAKELVIATFNTEFLTRPRVHRKFGLPFEIQEPSAKAQWSEPGYRDARFREAARAVAAVLAKLHADVIGLTETGDRRDVDELAAELKTLGVDYPYVEVCECLHEPVFQSVAILSKFPLTEVETSIDGWESYDRELDDPDSETETSAGKAMAAKFEVGGEEFRIYVVHLSSERGGHEKDAQRVAQASIVRRHYLPRLNAGEHVIVVGDLNDHPGQPAIRRIRGRDDIGPDLIQTGRWEYFSADEQSSRWTYEFHGRREQIDYVLLSRSIRQLVGESGIRARVFEHSDPLASDHRPFIVELQLP